MESKDLINVKIERSVVDELKRIGTKDETYSSILKRLIQLYCDKGTDIHKFKKKGVDNL